MPYINIQIKFEEETEDWDNSFYTHYTPISATFLESDIHEDGLDQIAEASGQSDRYQVGLNNAIMAVIGGGFEKVSSWY